ncbi:hypothetical protein CR513_39665, partial [Mucuna pruriens]
MSKSSIQELLVKEAHKEGLMGHFGVRKTYEALCEHFYWATCTIYVKDAWSARWPMPKANLEDLSKAQSMVRLYGRAMTFIERQGKRYAERANMDKEERVFEERDLVWVHIRKERFGRLEFEDKFFSRMRV